MSAARRARRDARRCGVLRRSAARPRAPRARRESRRIAAAARNQGEGSTSGFFRASDEWETRARPKTASGAVNGASTDDRAHDATGELESLDRRVLALARELAGLDDPGPCRIVEA